MARFSINTEELEGSFLLTTSLSLFQSNQNFPNIKKYIPPLFATICHYFYFHKGYVKNQRRERTEDAEHHEQQPTECSMCFLDRGWSSRES